MCGVCREQNYKMNRESMFEDQETCYRTGYKIHFYDIKSLRRCLESVYSTFNTSIFYIWKPQNLKETRYLFQSNKSYYSVTLVL